MGSDKMVSVWQRALAVSAGAFLSACATSGDRGMAAVEKAAPMAVETASATEPTRPASAEKTPVIRPELDGRTVYQVLLGEIAIQRGEPIIAAHAYADAARRTGDLAVLTRAIQVAGAARKYDVALELTRRWVELEPGSTHAKQSLAGILAALGRWDDLEDSMQALLAADGEARPRNLMHLGRLFAAEVDRKQSMQRIYRMTEPYLGEAESFYARAAVAHSAGDAKSALEAVRKATELRETWDEPWLLEIQILGPEGAPEAAKRIAGYLSRHPGDLSMRMQLGRLYATLRDWPAARAEFERVASDSEGGAEALHAVGLIAVQQRDFDAAREIFEKLLAAGASDPAPLQHQLGLIAEERHDYEGALSHLRQVGDGEYRIAAQARIGIVLAKMGKVEEAIRHLHAVPTFNGDDRQRLVLAEAQVLREAKNYKGAFELLSKALEREPDQPDLLYDHAMLAERIQRFDVLEGNLNRLISLDPENAHAYNALGYTYADRNIRLEEARRLILKAIELAPDDVFVIDSMGWVLYRMGDHEGALRHLERAYAIRRDPEIAAHLGEVLWMSGRRDDARRIWTEARKEDPDNEVLAAAIQKFLK